MVEEGVRHVLGVSAHSGGGEAQDDKLAWFGALRDYAPNAEGEHAMAAVRRSIAQGRSENEE